MEYFSYGLHAASGVAISPDGSCILVANGSNVACIDVNTKSIVFQDFPDDSDLYNFRGVAISSCGSFALVTSSGGCFTNDIGKIDLSSWEISFPYSGCPSPNCIAISSDDSFALVTNNDRDVMNRIDLSTGTITRIAAPAVDRCWKGVAISADCNFALIASMDSSSVARGEELFIKNCAKCHGESGNGYGPVTQGFTTWPRQLWAWHKTGPETDGYIYWFITNGRSDMPPWGVILSEKERWDLVSYVKTLKPPSSE